MVTELKSDVKFGVVQDIHGDLKSLEAVLDFMKGEPIDFLYVGGDLIGNPLTKKEKNELEELAAVLVYFKQILQDGTMIPIFATHLKEVVKSDIEGIRGHFIAEALKLPNEIGQIDYMKTLISSRNNPEDFKKNLLGLADRVIDLFSKQTGVFETKDQFEKYVEVIGEYKGKQRLLEFLKNYGPVNLKLDDLVSDEKGTELIGLYKNQITESYSRLIEELNEHKIDLEEYIGNLKAYNDKQDPNFEGLKEILKKTSDDLDKLKIGREEYKEVKTKILSELIEYINIKKKDRLSKNLKQIVESVLKERNVLDEVYQNNHGLLEEMQTRLENYISEKDQAEDLLDKLRIVDREIYTLKSANVVLNWVKFFSNIDNSVPPGLVIHKILKNNAVEQICDQIPQIFEDLKNYHKLKEEYGTLSESIENNMKLFYSNLEKILTQFKEEKKVPLFVVPGGYDLSLDETALSQYDLHYPVFSNNQELKEIKGLRILGYGGATDLEGDTLHPFYIPEELVMSEIERVSEDNEESDLEVQTNSGILRLRSDIYRKLKSSGKVDIILSHQPAYEILDVVYGRAIKTEEGIAIRTKNIGSLGLREYINGGNVSIIVSGYNHNIMTPNDELEVVEKVETANEKFTVAINSGVLGKTIDDRKIGFFGVVSLDTNGEFNSYNWYQLRDVEYPRSIVWITQFKRKNNEIETIRMNRRAYNFSTPEDDKWFEENCKGIKKPGEL